MTNDPNDEIKFTVDKFIFRFPRKVHYSPDGLWIMQENGLLRIGMSDFVQQRNGDIAFATLTSAGAELNAGDEIASIETVKEDLERDRAVLMTAEAYSIMAREQAEAELKS